MDLDEPVPVAAAYAEAEAVPAIAGVRDYWRGLNGGRLPARRAFDFMAVYRQAPHLLLAQRTEPFRYSFVYCGTVVAENFPLDLTGKSYGPDTPKVSKVPWPRLFTAAIDGPAVHFGRWTIDWPGPRFEHVSFGVFPLSGDDRRPQFALACLVFGGDRSIP
jgi:hypothetical protein